MTKSIINCHIESRKVKKYFNPRTLGLLLISLFGFTINAYATDLKVLNTGLGSGSIDSSLPGISCPGDCEQSYAVTDSVTLTATPSAGSVFVRWDGDAFADPAATPDCSGTSTTCILAMNNNRSVRPVFALATPLPTITDFTPEGLQAYLTANPTVDTAAEFVNALPVEFKRNWLLMSRSESLQTGTAQFPRILLPNSDARFVFTLGMTTHSSYPGAHPDAIEYMQWDATEKNFRFHEIVLTAIAPVDTDGDGVGVIPARIRGVTVDDEKCSKCHSTRNVFNPGTTAGTTGIIPGAVKAKNKPNWDTYDSWGGLAPFNRDRIYKGSLGAATFRKLFNPWTWSTNDAMRSVMEQLELQPPGVPAAHVITRTSGGTNDGHVNFVFDDSPPVLIEPAPSGTSTISTNYSFNAEAGSGLATTVQRGGTFITLHHADTPVSPEGRGVQLFDLLGGADGNLNPQRIADELIDHTHATGSMLGNVRLIDVRPIALAIAKGSCLNINEATNTVMSSGDTELTVDQNFFVSRHGLTINQLLSDTRARAKSLPLRKADIQKLNLDRILPDGSGSHDIYLDAAENGLIQEYGSATSQGPSVELSRIRQEIFRRPNDAGVPDDTFMEGIYVDRELHGSNPPKLALYRFFLEPLGVSVDKWSMGVRGRSRTYTFADVFNAYQSTFRTELGSSLLSDPIAGLIDPNSCDQLITAINSTLSSVVLPDADGMGAVPTYTDIQRIFNKSCIECHGGLDYPPYSNYGVSFDISEEENPSAPDDRLDRSHNMITSAYVTADPATSYLYDRITNYGDMIDPSDDTKTVPYGPGSVDETCPYGVMPCDGPPLAQADIETVRRWIIGGNPNTRGDPHIKTVDDVHYDFQAAGEFVLLRGQGIEIQARHTPVVTHNALGANAYTGLTSCVSINTAIAVKVGQHRITYQPNLNQSQEGRINEGLQLSIDGKPVQLTTEGIRFGNSGRIIPTSAAGGIQIEAPGGTTIILTPGFWNPYQVWYLNVDTKHVRATQGLMGSIAPGSWLPALPDGSGVGPRPTNLQERYKILYGQFGRAWRVTKSNSLFDYAPGISTQTFNIGSWPKGESPQNCQLPTGVELPPGITTPAELPEPLSLEIAQQHCNDLVEDAARNSCVQDVMVTGEPGFAETYLRAEKITLNTLPTPPVLSFPERFQTEISFPINFTWTTSEDDDAETLTYQHCLWEADETFNLDNCNIEATVSSPVSSGVNYALIVGLAALAIFVLFLLFGGRKKPKLVILFAILIVAIIVIAFYLGWSNADPKSLNKSVSDLNADTTYNWKVIVDDGQGGTVESELRQFKVE